MNVRILGGDESDDGRDANGMRRVAMAGPTAREIAYQKSFFEAAGDEPIEMPQTEAELAKSRRRTAANANDLTGRPDRARYPRSFFHRLFDVGEHEPANDTTEGGTSERELNARAARHDGSEPTDPDEADSAPGAWKRGGWSGGGVLSGR